MPKFPKRPITAATNTDAFTMTIITVVIIVQGVVRRASWFLAVWLNTTEAWLLSLLRQERRGSGGGSDRDLNTTTRGTAE
jgi:hypothetical protein